MRKVMQVLQVYRTYFPDLPGGVQEVMRQIGLATSAMGVDTKIFALSPSPVPKELVRPEGVVTRVRSWAAPASCDLGGIVSFREFAQCCQKSDVVHYHFPWPFGDLLHTITQPKIPALMTYHSDVIKQKILGKFYMPLRWHMMKSMRIIVATSPAYARTSPILSHPSIREKVRVIPSGIVEEYYSKVSDASVFNRLNISLDEPYFLFIGVLRYYKGLHTLVQAARHVGAKIVIAGSGPENRNLQNLAIQLGAKNILFAGQISDAEKVALLQSCRALVLPSHLRSEAFGMVLVEAAMFGRPQISCEIGTGTSFVNAHQESGIVIPPENPTELGRAMSCLLDDRAMADRMGLAARTRYERLFSGAALGNAYANLYREVAGQS